MTRLILTDLLLAGSERYGGGLIAYLQHLGMFGLFSVAILDSLPLPIFGGPDILTAILAASHRNPWYEYVAVATAGSVIGALLTFTLARRAGLEYLNKSFGSGRVPGILRLFERWGTGALIVGTAFPFPFPTGVFYAAAGASAYPAKKYLVVIAVSRVVRYSLVAILADHYGQQFFRANQHPDQFWGWVSLVGAIIAGIAAGWLAIKKRFEAPCPAQ